MFSVVSLTISAVAVYLCASLIIALLTSRSKHTTSNDFLNASRTLPTWIVSISFLACNSGALEVLGLSGIAARYGVQAFHFYWIGAVPALIFVSFIMLPAYLHSGVRSVPDYLGRRFGPSVRLLNALTVVVSTTAYAGISLYGIAEIMHVIAGWSFGIGLSIFAPIVIGYVLIGGIRATVYNEIPQFVLMILGLAPLLYFTRTMPSNAALKMGQYWHLWQKTSTYSKNDPVDCIGVILGLGLIISFSYWCTDFALMQRALTARTLESARRVPLIAGIGKLLISFVVVLPAVLMAPEVHLKSSGVISALDETAPALMQTLYSPKLLCLGIAALVAGLINTFASNLSAFSSVWTEEIYRTTLRPGRSEPHYIAMGRFASIACTFASIAAAYAAHHFENLSEFVLLVFSLFVVPFFAIILTGVLSQRGTTRSALSGALSGIFVGGMAHVAFAHGWMFPISPLSASFYSAIFSFSAALFVCNLPHKLAQVDTFPSDLSLRGSIDKPSLTLLSLVGILASACLVLNLLWW